MVRHRDVVKAEAGRVYAERSFIGHRLHEAHFAALNAAKVRRDAHGALYEVSPAAINTVNGYCLDAPDSMPQGCMGSPCESPAQMWVKRGVDWEEHQRRERLMQELIDEVLAERAAT